MDRTNADRRASVTDPECEQEAIEFVRFCYRRRRVGWPELYDEMCAVAGRGLYQGYGTEELASIGIAFGLFQMPGLAVLVGRVVDEDAERRRRSAVAVRASLIADAQAEVVAADHSEFPDHSAVAEGRLIEPEAAAEVAVPEIGGIRLAAAGA